jgi:hypothetical protein
VARILRGDRRVRRSATRHHALIASKVWPVCELVPADKGIFMAVEVPIIIFTIELLQEERFSSGEGPAFVCVVPSR